ncbi:DUF981 family protein [Arthrobacter sp. PAMC25564]|uniref:DUF981 family protein n=1 Tax=Arthrobacter sp. PAMC25564 TaxID=2565366 RepID=UPI0010A25AC8|nr:DUF981 family protein [Arthrobacter sp. PAMC25564]QCB95584.1 DUF981 family protein [Arthrobacter sp. PAMC25564]
MSMTTEALKIDWAIMPTYNTIMSLAAGAGLLAVVIFSRDLFRFRRNNDATVSTDGWSLAFGVLGLILTTTGLHMTLTWPLAAGGFPFDNIIFGETSLGFGVPLLGAAFYLWRRGEALTSAPDPIAFAANTVRPLSLFIGGLGLSLFAIAAAGVTYQLFAAPAQEPISGAFAAYPIIEATFMSGLFALVGVGAVLFPFAIAKLRTSGAAASGLVKTIGIVWYLTGLAFLLFGAMNYFTHIGLIVNTM